MRLKWTAAAILLPILAGAAFAPLPGHTRLHVAADKGDIASTLLADGQLISLTWRNSQFGLAVTEVFRARQGTIVQEGVTFSDSAGTPPVVSARDVEDLYHTGGAFAGRGLERPFTRIVYRVGEIGNPVLHLPARSISLKEAAGFGGRVVVTAQRARLYELLFTRGG